MRPIQLEIKGLNSFMEKQSVDFDELTKSGLFGIFGPTGSGKTTILDGITLALYGKIARKSKNFINANSENATIVFEFQITGNVVKRYRVERVFKTDKKTGGVKTSKSLLIDVTGEPEVLADKKTEVDNLCQDIIGLNSEDFQRTVVLPQGKFSDFLKLEGNERSKMLERLFGLEEYGDQLTFRLKRKREAEELQMADVEGQLKTYDGISENSLLEQQDVYEELKKLLMKQQTAQKQILDEYEKKKEIWKLQEELEEHQEKQKELEKHREAMEELSQKLKLAERASRVIPLITEWKRLNQDLIAAKEKREKNKVSLEQVSAKKEKMDQDWEQAKLEKEERIPKLQEEYLKVKEAISLKEDLEAVHAEILKRIEEKKRLEEKKKQYSKNCETAEQKKIETDKKILELEKKSREYLVDSSLRTQVRNGVLLEKQILNLSKQLDKERVNLQNQEEVVQNAEKELSAIGEKLFAGEVIADYNAFAKKMMDLQKDRAEYDTYVQNVKMLETQLAERRKLQHSASEQMKLQTEKVQELEKKRRKLETEAFAYQLRKELKDGSPCPVCGSIHHEIVLGENFTQEDIEQAAKELEKEQKLLEQCQRAEMKQTAELENLERQKRELEQKKEKLDVSCIQKTVEEYGELLVSLSNYREKESAQKARVHMLDEQKINFARRQQEKEHIESEKKKLSKESGMEDFLEMEEKITQLDQQYHENEMLLKEKRTKSEEYQSIWKQWKEQLSAAENRIAAHVEAIFQKEKQAEEKNKKLSALGKIEITLDALKQSRDSIKEEGNGITLKYRKLESLKLQLDEEYNKINKTYIEITTQIEVLSDSSQKQERAMEAKLKEEQFTTMEECQSHVMEKDVAVDAARQVEKFQSDTAVEKKFVEEKLQKLGDRRTTKQEWEEIQTRKLEMEAKLETLKQEYAKASHQLEDLKKKLEAVKDLLEEKKKREHQLGLLDDLMKLFRGKRFVEYVAHSRLRYISKAAGKRLHEISNGNYGLEVDEEGKFIICDYKNGGIKRDSSTLSGGETFLVSLSLSLALSEQVQLKGSAPLELFFLDEGFGTLDDTLLDVVMDSLEKIQNDRLKVGIISHVESIKNRVPVKLIVTPSKAGMGGSKIKIERN